MMRWRRRIIDDDNDNGDDNGVDAIESHPAALLHRYWYNQFSSIHQFIYIGKITTYLYMDGLLSIMNGTCLWPFINTIVSENPDTAPTSTKYVHRR